MTSARRIGDRATAYRAVDSLDDSRGTPPAPPAPPPPPRGLTPREARIPVSPLLRPGDLVLARGERLVTQVHSFAELGMREPPGGARGFIRYKILDEQGRLVRHYIRYLHPEPLPAPPDPPPIPSLDAREARGLPVVPIARHDRAAPARKHKTKRTKAGPKDAERETEAGRKREREKERRLSDEEFINRPPVITRSIVFYGAETVVDKLKLEFSQQPRMQQLGREIGLTRAGDRVAAQVRKYIRIRAADFERTMRLLQDPATWRRFWTEVRRVRSKPGRLSSFEEFRSWWEDDPGIFYCNVVKFVLLRNVVGDLDTSWRLMDRDLKVLWATKQQVLGLQTPNLY